METKEELYELYDKFIKENSIEDKTENKYAFFEGYYQGMRFMRKLLEAERNGKK